MKKTTNEEPKGVKVGDVPFEKIVEGFLKVELPKEKKPKKTKGLTKKD